MTDLKIDISALLQAIGSELKVELASDLFRRQRVFDLSGPLLIKLKLINAGEQVLAQGGVSVPWRLHCARCGRIFEQQVEVPLAEQFYRHRPTDLPPGERGFVVQNDKYIDLTEMLRQNIILASPDKPICSPDCPPVKYSTGGNSGKVLAEKLKSLKIKGDKRK